MKVEISLDMSQYKLLGPAMPEVRKRGLNYTAQYMIEQLQVTSPRDTGYLAGWFRERDEPFLVDIRSPAQYAYFQDQGTYSYGPAKRKPKTKPVGGIKPKRFVERSIKATSARLDSFFIKAINEAIK